MHIHVYPPENPLPGNIILPLQCHGTSILEVVSGTEDLSQCDGLWTINPSFTLGVKTADCAPVCFYEKGKIGILHAGWRGLVAGICEKMLELFPDTGRKIFIGPLLSEFEIQRDFCYEAISEKFGDKFFDQRAGKIIFRFKDALSSVLPGAEFDPRSTYDDTTLASWRRDKVKKRSNVTVIAIESDIH
jgi:hypothetical protein